MIGDLNRQRVQTPILKMTLPDENILNVPHGQYRLVSDGYWVFFKPLKQITKITSLGACSSGITKIGIHYVREQDKVTPMLLWLSGNYLCYLFN